MSKGFFIAQAIAGIAMTLLASAAPPAGAQGTQPAQGGYAQRYAAVCFLVGIVLFSGSLYALCFLDIGKLGMITPVGGVFLIVGWVLLALSVARK